MEWPPEIQALWHELPGGYLTVNELEQAGMNLHYMILAGIVDLKHVHMACWCDNRSATCWTDKMSSPKSAIGALLVQGLVLRMTIDQASPLGALPIQGILNKLADLLSRSYNAAGGPGNYEWDNLTFFNKFNRRFPLTPQGTSWHIVRPATVLISRVSSLLLGKQSTMESLI